MEKKSPGEFPKKPEKRQSSGNPKYLNDLTQCIEVLKSGGIILFPTDTVWSIGCDATNEGAVKKLYDLRQQQNELHTLSVLVDHADRIGRHVKQIPEVAIQLIEVNDKPMTIFYPGVVNLAANLIAADGSAGIRISGDEFCKRLVAALSRPVASASANLPDEDEPEKFREISDAIKNGVDYVVHWRQNDPAPCVTPSVIKVGLRGEIQIIRQ
jgi:L-threonylcarbamoyladenylate synthase